MSESQSGPAGKLENSADVKKKQFFLLAVIGIGVLLAAFFTTLFGDGGDTVAKQKKNEPLSKTNIATAGSKVDPREVWIGTAGNQIATLEKDKQALEDRIRRLEERTPEGRPPNGMPSNYALPPPPPVPLPVALPPTSPALSMSEPVRGAGQMARADVGVYGHREPANAALATSVNPIATTLVGAGALSVVEGSEIPQRAVTEKNTKAAAVSPVSAPAGARPPAQTPDKDLTREDYLPAGSFFRAVMLSGLDAPTGGQVQANPHPVLLRLVDNAVLPNYFRGQVKECFVVAAGYGDMSSERAYLRTESLSCVNKNGQVIDVAISGWAIGDDGKAGVRGRLVSKQGQALANAIASGVLSGIGSAIRESSVNTQVGGFSGAVVQTPKPGQEFRAGLGEGVSKGLDRLTDYYIKLAERMFPVVEIDAGRVVDIALSKGMSLKGLFKQEATASSDGDDISALARRRVQQSSARQAEGL
jgi:conjugal transfer pilus assembly protein TraB